MAAEGNRKKIIYILSHPIQYYSPLFKYIHERGDMDCQVWYQSDHGLAQQIDDQFGVNVQWDIPLLEGYPYLFIKNTSPKPGVYNGFFGIFNWRIIGMLFHLPSRTNIIVPGWNSLAYVMALIFGNLFGHKVCMRGDPPLSHEFLKGRLSRIFRFIAFRGILFPCVNKFLYVGTQNRNFYTYYGVRDSRLIPARHAVDNDFFQRERARLLPLREQLRTNLGIPPENRVILFCGKFIPKKNPLDLLNAFQHIPPQIKSTLIFLGEGELRGEMESFISSNKMKNVLITGFINQSRISEYYCLADLFVMCSGAGETWGLSTNEAMNFGLPVLISDLTGNAPDLVDGNGYVFKTNDVSDLSKHLNLLLSASEMELKNMGDRSLSIIKQFNYQAIAEGILKI